MHLFSKLMPGLMCHLVQKKKKKICHKENISLENYMYVCTKWRGTEVFNIPVREKLAMRFLTFLFEKIICMCVQDAEVFLAYHLFPLTPFIIIEKFPNPF